MSRKGGNSAVEKLAMLRAFLPEVDESTMSACLSACGYNVERAAEHLMTGQFTSADCASGKKKKSLFTFNVAATNTNVRPDQKRQKMSKCKPTQSARAEPTSLKKRKPNLHENSDPVDINYLLCQRWISNGVSRSKNGRVAFEESLTLIFGGPIIRFQSLNLEGSLPTNLCAILTPLEGLINISATALMEDRNIGIGKEVPLSLRINLTDPKAFFALFQDRTSANTTAAAFFANQQKKPAKSTRKVKTMDLADAAFALLQWAEYGDVQEFKVTEKPIVEEIFEIDDVEEPLANEDEFHANDTEEQTAIANNVLGQGGNEGLPEARDPNGLRGITLRPYQRQALYWMTKREKEPSSRAIVERELELLSELTKSNKKQRVYNTALEVSCEDSGPIRVSEIGAQRSKTLDGVVNPLNHPLWDRRYLAVGDSQAVCFFVNELIGIATAVAPSPPRQCVGGVLGDAMGMGKTVQIAALILACKEEEAEDKEIDSEDLCIVEPGKSKLAYKTTLVVGPMSLLYQWEEEIKTKTNLTHRVYYKENTTGTIGHNSFVGVDVVITTYGTIQGELHEMIKKGSINKGLLSYDWHRVVLDEAHNIKNPTTLVSKACYLLKAECRWAVTGTPITNSLQDIFSLIKFLRHEPWCETGFWRASITNAISIAEKGSTPDEKNPGGMKIALDRIRRLLDPLLLRRTKESLNDDGTPILTLPPVESIIVSVQLSPAEREFYSALKAKSQNIFEGLIESGTANNAWFAIFGLLNRLRQASCHIALIAKKYMNVEDWNSDAGDRQIKKAASPVKKAVPVNDLVNEEFMESLLTKFRTSASGTETESITFATNVAEKLAKAINSAASEFSEECPICLETPKVHDAVCTPCAHVFCRDCLVDYLTENGPKSKNHFQRCPDGKCPNCNEKIEARKIIALYKNADGQTKTCYLWNESSHASTNRIAPKQDTPTKITTAVARQTLEDALHGAGSAKLKAILKELEKVWDQDPGSKVLIFSQFLGFLDLIGTALTQEGIPHGRLDGSLSARERVQAIEKFKLGSNGDSRIGSVMLLSTKSGGVGLNLVVASTVFIADPWWNQAVEDQCIDRVHRIGQTASVVRVRKFIVENSVEERIVELQGKKKGMASRVLCDCDDADDVDHDQPSLDDFKLLFGT